MPKVQAPAPATPQTETESPAPDLSILTGRLAPILAETKEIEGQLKSKNLDLAVAVREFREENPNLERSDCKLAIQQAVANAYNLKLAQVQNDNKAKDENGKSLKGYSAYVLVSMILSVAWPKGEAEEKRVQKALQQGKGWLEVKQAASKPQANKNTDPTSRRITVDNFAVKLNTFLTQAQTDIGEPIEGILDRAEAAITAMRNAPPA